MNDFEKVYQSFDFANDLIFIYVLSSDIELCRDLIRRISPDIDTEGIHFVETEHEIIVGVKDEKRVRFDIMTRTERSVTDLEMYAHRPKEIPKTARYNAAMVDSQLTKNHLPDELPDVTVIILCTYDPFGLNEPIYRIRTTVDEHPDYDYNEGRRIFILTNKGIDKAPPELKPLIHLLSRSAEPMNDPFYIKVQAAVEDIKTNTDVRRAAMLLAERDDAIREEGREQGRAEGRQEAQKEDVEKTVRILREIHLSDQEIFSRLLAEYPADEMMLREIIRI